MTQQTVTKAEAAEIVRGLANGLSLQKVTENSDLPYAEVARIAKANGYPNRVMLAQSADRLERGETPPAARPAVPAARLVEAVSQADRYRSLGQLLAKARELGLGRKADKITDLVDELEELVREQEPLAQALAELARAQAKVEELRGAVRAAKPTAGDGLDRETRKAVRAWAVENGYAAAGPTVRREVVEAYRAAHTTTTTTEGTPA